MSAPTGPRLLQRLLRPSTARRLASWVLLGSVGVLVASLAFVVLTAESSVRRSSSDTLTALALASANGVAARTGGVEMTARVIANAIGRRLNSPEFIETLLSETVVAHPDIGGVAAAFEPDAVAGAARLYAPFFAQEGSAALRRDLADSPNPYLETGWYRRAAACERGCWGEIFHSASRDQILINFGVPIHDAGGKLVGVVNVDVQQRWLQRLIDSVRPDRASFAFLLSDSGTILADARPERIGTSMLELAEHSTNPDFAALARRMLAGETGSVEYVSPTLGIPVRTFFTPVPESSWSLAVVVPHVTYVRDAQKLFAESVAIGSFGLAVLGLFVWLAVRRLLAPLGQLAANADRVARGELDFHLDRPRSMDEVGRLTGSFARMRDELKQHIAELTEATAARERLQSELEIAQHIQESMLPKSHYVGPGAYPFELQALLRPARVVGGDLYSYVSRSDGHLCFLIGDVSDKGIPAALFMARTITAANSRARAVDAPEELLRQLNLELCAGNEDCMFVTVLCGVLDLASGSLALASAGHDAPIRLADGGAAPLPLETAAPLGLDPDTVFPRARAALAPGDTIVLFTDGVTEALAPDGSFYGEQRMLRALARSERDPSGVIAALAGDVAAFTRDAPLADDMTILALRWYGPAAVTRDLAIEMGAQLGEVGAALDRIDEWLGAHGIADETRGDIRVAIEELLVNAVDYGFPDGADGGRLGARLAVDAGAVRVALADNGAAYDPFSREPPDIDAADDEREPGGLGVYLVTRLAREFSYRREDDRNRIDLLFAAQSVSAEGRTDS